MNRRARRTAVEGYTLRGPAQVPLGGPITVTGAELPATACGQTARWTLSWTYPRADGAAGRGAASGWTATYGRSFTATVTMPEDASPIATVHYRALVDCAGQLFTTNVLPVRIGSDNRLYGLLPEIYRLRDEEFADRPLQTLLGVIGDQLQQVDADIRQLYANWFIETCEPLLLPYLADLVGYQLLPAEWPDAMRATRRSFPPYARRSIADAVSARRVTGTFRLLTSLGADITGWSTAPVEQHTLVLTTADVRDAGPRRTLPDVRDPVALEEIGTAFDSTQRTVRVSDSSAELTTVTPRLSAVAMTVWRQSGFPVPALRGVTTESGLPVVPVPAHRLIEGLFTFNWLGRNCALMTSASRLDPRATDAMSTVRPLGRARLRAHVAEYYGPARSLCVYYAQGPADDQGKAMPDEGRLVAVLPGDIVVADLSAGDYRPPSPRVAVDPVLGRLASAGHDKLWVSYCYSFPDALGGGAYPRGPYQDAEAPWAELTASVGSSAQALLGEVGPLLRRRRALPDDWTDVPPVRLDLGFGRHELPRHLNLADGDRLMLRAVDGVRVETTTDESTHRFVITAPAPPAGSTSRRTTLTLDGLLIHGSVKLRGRFDEVRLRDCTLVPVPGLPSLQITGTVESLHLERSILGPVQFSQATSATVAVGIADSILDAGQDQLCCLASEPPGRPQIRLTAERVTFLGSLCVGSAVGTDCIVTGTSSRGDEHGRQPAGLLTYSYLTWNEHDTGRGEGCQPELCEPPAPAGALEDGDPHGEPVDLRARPVFTSRDYPSAWYGQLAASCPVTITAGAHDGAAMGAYHDLDVPARADSLRRRLAESIPVGMTSSIVWAR